MVCEIMHDEAFLAQKAEPAVPEDLYQNDKFQTRFKTFTGWTAQIIQHEIDHCEGVLI